MNMSLHPDTNIPSHVIDTDNTTKRRQRKSYVQTIRRAGFTSSGRPSLSCIEREQRISTGPIDYRNSQKNGLVSATSKTNMMIPWLGAASKSLISSLQSSRSRNAKEDTSKQHGEKSISKKMSVQTERILDLDTSIAAAADPLGQGLFQTNISDGFGKLVHPNGTIKYIGMVRLTL